MPREQSRSSSHKKLRKAFNNIFLVPKKDGRMGPVINLRALNQFINVQHFKMEGIHTSVVDIAFGSYPI